MARPVANTRDLMLKPEAGGERDPAGDLMAEPFEALRHVEPGENPPDLGRACADIGGVVDAVHRVTHTALPSGAGRAASGARHRTGGRLVPAGVCLPAEASPGREPHAIELGSFEHRRRLAG